MEKCLGSAVRAEAHDGSRLNGSEQGAASVLPVSSRGLHPRDGIQNLGVCTFPKTSKFW